MILFQEQINVKDDTLDPAYFAKRPRRILSNDGNSTIDDATVQRIQNKITILEERIEQLETIIELLQGTDHREITSTAYKALDDDEKMADVVWFVTKEV